jgi:hypothetical protein
MNCTLPHRLPVAIYSYLSGDERAPRLVVAVRRAFARMAGAGGGRELGAALRFIDLPAWHDAFSRHAQPLRRRPTTTHQEMRAEAYLDAR